MKQTTLSSHYMKSALIGGLLGLSLAVAFASGFFLSDRLDNQIISSVRDTTNGYPLLGEVQVFIDQVYLREQPSSTVRQYAAIRGMLGSLGDSNTFFIEPPVAQSEADALAGTYGGIGVLLQRNEKGEYVLFPFDDSPAQRLGIQDNDVLIAINGVLLTGGEHPDAIDQQLRGEVKDGTGVTLQLQRAEQGLIEVFIPFEAINVPSVVWRVLSEDARLGYIQVMRFTNRTPDELTQALSELGEQAIAGLILDLRNNSGGLLEESIQVADVFLKEGVIVYEKSRQNTKNREAKTGELGEELPLVVLVNNRSASAAELVAGALQDSQRAILIGQRTYGKGTVQQILTLTDGSSVHITSAEWLTPNETPIDRIGLTPDIEMIPDVNGRDVEIGEAIRYLQQQMP